MEYTGQQGRSPFLGVESTLGGEVGVSEQVRAGSQARRRCAWGPEVGGEGRGGTLPRWKAAKVKGCRGQQGGPSLA